MTLHHLAMVDDAILATIEALANEKKVPGKVSTAAVKPALVQRPEIVEQFRKLVTEYTGRVEKLPDLHSNTRHDHPWFGPLNAHGWHCLAGLHHRIHRRQIEAIIARLDV